MTGQPSIPVTIETLSEKATEDDRLNLMMKASMMRKFDDVNIVYLHGVVISINSPHLLVMEHMKYGSLLQLIRVCINKSISTTVIKLPREKLVSRR